MSDLLLHRYSQRLEDYSFGEAVQIALRASDADREEKVTAEYDQLLPYMLMGHLKYMAKETYIDRRTGRGIDWRPADEIIAEIKEAERSVQNGSI